MHMNHGIVRDDHYKEFSVFHRAAHRVQVCDGRELAAVLAQEQIHVFIAVVAELLRLDGLVFGWSYSRVGKDGGLDGVGGGGGGGGWRRVCRHADATGNVTDHRRQSEVQHRSLDVKDGHIEDGHGCVPGVKRKNAQACGVIMYLLHTWQQGEFFSTSLREMPLTL